MANRARPHRIEFRLSDSENDLVKKKIESAGIRNREAYIRKMVCEGYIIHMDFSGIREVIHLQRNATNNLNQIARHLNSGGNIHQNDMNAFMEIHEQIWQAIEFVAKKLARMKT
ncbi:MAG: plasmid mobilization relaxosome protein MobC [Defluviitaleaceae bacterium]|nr:plasmid mobilization relaxosome protein MobC [Defluviitaleaceae bacterium]MCL2238691.1 plasmid mobilization relaxosome protein MobC [Defluviitaleaceae bacterium]